MNYYDTHDYYDYSSPYMETTLIGILMICGIILIVWAIFALLSYILKGVGMYTMAKRQGMDYAWLAFIPFARTYLHGELAGSIRLKNKSIQNPGIWLLALPFLYGAVYSLLYGMVWFIGMGSLTRLAFNGVLSYGRTDLSGGAVMGIVVMVLILSVVSLAYTAVYKSFSVLVNHQILERFTTKNMSVAHAVLCTLVPLYESICLFVMRNRPFNPGMEPPAPQPFMQSPPPDTYYRGPVQPPVAPNPPAPPVGGSDENAFSTPDFGSTGSIFDTPDSVESKTTGSIFDTPDSAESKTTGSILDTPGSTNAEESSEEKVESSVNFTLPDNENKEI